MIAHAESAEKVYETEIPSVESHAPTEKSHSGSNQNQSGGTHKTSNNPKAEGSGTQTGTTKSPGANEAEPESEEEQGASGGVAPNGGNNNPPTSGGGHGGGNSAKTNGGTGNAKPEANVSKAQESPTTKGTNASKSSGGSSPLVPILIAIAVLAAISIGVVLYRQRKSDEGSGGADGRVSSSNAS